MQKEWDKGAKQRNDNMQNVTKQREGGKERRAKRKDRSKKRKHEQQTQKEQHRAVFMCWKERYA